MRLSLSNRLALVFFAITALAIGALYLYVAPGAPEPPDGREAHRALPSPRARTRAKLGRAVGSSTPLPDVRRLVNQTAAATGDRVTLLSVNYAQGSIQLSEQADSGAGSGPALRSRSPMQAVAAAPSGHRGGAPGRRARWPRRPSRCSIATAPWAG